MQKKKYDLTSDLVNVSKEVDIVQEKIEQEKKEALLAPAKVILLTMSIEEELRAEFKSWCARHRLKMNEAFVKGFKLLKDKYGP